MVAQKLGAPEQQASKGPCSRGWNNSPIYLLGQRWTSSLLDKLAKEENQRFNGLKKVINQSKTVSTYLKAFREAGLIEAESSLDSKSGRPVNLYKITQRGREAYEILNSVDNEGSVVLLKSEPFVRTFSELFESPLSFCDLRKAINTDYSNSNGITNKVLSNVLKPAQDAGLIERQEHGRSFSYSLTSAGEELYLTLIEPVLAWEQYNNPKVKEEKPKE